MVALKRKLLPSVPEDEELDNAHDDAARPSLYGDDVDEGDLPSEQFKGLRSKGKIFDSKAKEGYYSLSAEMRRGVMRLHRALVHLPAIDLARILADAGAKLEVVEWTKRHF